MKSYIFWVEKESQARNQRKAHSKQNQAERTKEKDDKKYHSDVDFTLKFESSTSEMYIKIVDSVKNIQHQMNDELEKQS
jgi:hypothetical protein